MQFRWQLAGSAKAISLDERETTTANSVQKLSSICEFDILAARISNKCTIESSLKSNLFAVANLNRISRSPSEKSCRLIHFRDQTQSGGAGSQHLNVRRHCLIPFYGEEFKLVARPTKL